MKSLILLRDIPSAKIIFRGSPESSRGGRDEALENHAECLTRAENRAYDTLPDYSLPKHMIRKHEKAQESDYKRAEEQCNADLAALGFDINPEDIKLEAKLKTYYSLMDPSDFRGSEQQFIEHYQSLSGFRKMLTDRKINKVLSRHEEFLSDEQRDDMSWNEDENDSFRGWELEEETTKDEPKAQKRGRGLFGNFKKLNEELESD